MCRSRTAQRGARSGLTSPPRPARIVRCIVQLAMRHWVRGWKRWVLVGVAVTAALLMIAQDQETLRIESPVAASDARFADYVASLVGAPVQTGDYTPLRNGDDVFPAMLDAIRQREGAHQLRELHLRGRRGRRGLHHAARRGGAPRRHGARRARRLRQHAVTGVARRAGSEPGSRSSGSIRCGRGRSKRPTTARTARSSSSTATSRSPAAWASPITGWATRRIRTHWRDTQFKVTGSGGARAGGGVLRELARVRRRIGAGTRSREARSRHPARARSSCGATRPAARATSSCCICSSIAGARQSIDIQSPYLILDESTRWSLDRGARARRPRAAADRRRHHRCQAGQVRQPARLPGAARRRLRDLRVPADDDAREGDDRRRRVERDRVGQLRQPIVRAERRADGGRRRRRASPPT